MPYVKACTTEHVASWENHLTCLGAEYFIIGIFIPTLGITIGLLHGLKERLCEMHSMSKCEAFY